MILTSMLSPHSRLVVRREPASLAMERCGWRDKRSVTNDVDSDDEAMLIRLKLDNWFTMFLLIL